MCFKHQRQITLPLLGLLVDQRAKLHKARQSIESNEWNLTFSIRCDIPLGTSPSWLIKKQKFSASRRRWAPQSLMEICRKVIQSEGKFHFSFKCFSSRFPVHRFGATQNYPSEYIMLNQSKLNEKLRDWRRKTERRNPMFSVRTRSLDLQMVRSWEMCWCGAEPAYQLFTISLPWNHAEALIISRVCGKISGRKVIANT